MEKCRETSERHQERALGLIFFAVILAAWLAAEINTLTEGRISIVGLGFIFAFIIIMIWRYVFRYTTILTGDTLTIISHGVGIRRTLQIPLDQTDFFSNNYLKSFLRQKKISSYAHRYSSFDAHPVRVLVFNKDGKRHAVLFKSSNKFIEELKKIMPKNYVDLEIKKKS